MKKLLIASLLICLAIPCVARQYYFVLDTNATNSTGDDVQLLSNKYAVQDRTKDIFFGSTRAIMSIDFPGTIIIQPADIAAWNVTQESTAEVLALQDPALIDYGFNAVDFIGVATPE